MVPLTAMLSETFQAVTDPLYNIAKFSFTRIKIFFFFSTTVLLCGSSVKKLTELYMTKQNRYASDFAGAGFTRFFLVCPNVVIMMVILGSVCSKF